MVLGGAGAVGTRVIARRHWARTQPKRWTGGGSAKFSTAQPCERIVGLRQIGGLALSALPNSLHRPPYKRDLPTGHTWNNPGTQAQSEHQAKTKAELALTERAGALSECIEQKMALAGEVAQCHFDLKSLLSGENHGAMSRASADALGKMSKMSREQELRSGEEEQHRAAASGLGSGNFGTA